jgi:hypothetical protein
VKTRIISKVTPRLSPHITIPPPPLLPVQTGSWYDLSGVDILISLFDLLQFSEVSPPPSLSLWLPSP